MLGSAETPQANDFVEDALGNFALAQLRERQVAAIAREQGDDIRVVVEAGAFRGHVICYDEIGILGGQFFAGVLCDVVGLGGESNDDSVAFCVRSFG